MNDDELREYIRKTINGMKKPTWPSSYDSVALATSIANSIEDPDDERIQRFLIEEAQAIGLTLYKPYRLE